MRAEALTIPHGDPGTVATLRVMERLVRRATRDGSVIAWAQDVVRGVPERDPDGAARAFLTWVRAATRYTEDPADVEAVKTPATQIAEYVRSGVIAADCDDQVVLLAAGLQSVGIPTQFVTISEDEGEFHHVLMAYRGRTGWVTLDPIVRGADPGWFPPTARRVGSYRNGAWSVRMRGLGRYAQLSVPTVLKMRLSGLGGLGQAQGHPEPALAPSIPGDGTESSAAGRMASNYVPPVPILTPAHASRSRPRWRLGEYWEGGFPGPAMVGRAPEMLPSGDIDRPSRCCQGPSLWRSVKRGAGWGFGLTVGVGVAALVLGIRRR